MRAAGPASVAGGRWRRWSAAATGGGARADGDVHGHDRWYRRRRRRRRSGFGPVARSGRGGADRLRPGPARARSRPIVWRHACRGSPRFGRGTRGVGFPSGLLVGAALGFVYTPCAGPILAAVISVSAASGRTVAVVIAYALGSAAVLLALTLGGRNLFDRIRARRAGPALQRTLGVVMLVTARRDRDRLDVRLRPVRRRTHPRSQPHRRPREIASRRDPPAETRDGPMARSSRPERKHLRRPATRATRSCWPPRQGLKNLVLAPEFENTEDWFNTPGNRTTSRTGLRGHVVLVDSGPIPASTASGRSPI